ncbi:outer membrane protein P6 precursor [mine drainage metagenome]|uniref:Outer membrane protein P6 n=1 Tax=mine drainage metagenome TaxID=410659 RepID=A0A1J5Q7C8_9ZZZZ
MIIRTRTTLSVAMAASVFLAACSSTPLATPAAVSTATPVAPAPAAPGPASNQPTAPAVVAATPLPAYLDPGNPLSKQRSVYFDFDQAAIKPGAAPSLELHGRYLAAHPEVAIKIEGNTDRQGGAEYNLALGQKRAEAVLESLKIFGVKDAQMEAISFGMEKPKALGNDETAYAQNRRADLDYPQK